MKKYYWFRHILLTIFVLASNPVFAELQWDPALARGQLDNGLRYVIYDSNKETDPFNLRLVVNAGSVDETGASGVAHMLEHMVFHKTRAHPEGLHAYIESLGWKTGLQINAVTRQTETQYMLRTRPDDALDMQGALMLLSEIAGFAKLDPEDWAKERGVILEEWRLGEKVAARINRQKKAVVRNGSRYVGRPTIGTEQAIRTTTADELRAFYDSYYVASNMTLIVSGNVDVSETLSAIKGSFGRLPTKPAPNRGYVALPLKPGLHMGLVQDEEGTSSLVAYGFRLTMPGRQSAEGQFAYLQNYFLRKLMRNQVMRDRALLPEGVESISLTIKEPTVDRLAVALAARTQDHMTGLKVILEEAERLRRDGLDQADFDALMARARKTVTRNVEAAKHRDFAKWEDKITEALMTGAVLEAPKVRSERTLQWLDRITLASLNERMRELLSETDQFLYFQVPGDREVALPSQELFQALRADAVRRSETLAKAIPLTPAKPKAEAAPEPGAEMPAIRLEPGVVEALPAKQLLLDSEVAALHEYILGNGDRVLWLEKPTSDNKLYAKLLTGSGYENDQFSPWLGQAAVQLWEQSGFNGWSEQQWQHWQKEQPHWTWSLKAGELDVAAIASEAELPTLLALYHHRLASGTIAEDALEQVRDSLLPSESNPLTRASLTLRYGQETLGPVAEEVAQLERSQLMQAAQALLAEPVTLYLVGELGNTDLSKLLAQTLANLSRARTLSGHWLAQQPGRHQQEVSLHRENKATVTRYSYTPMQWTPEQAFAVSTLTPVVQKALRQKLRMELSGVYRVTFEMKLDKLQNRVSSELSFTCAPERRQELLAAADEVLASLPEVVAKLDLDKVRSDIAFAEQGRLQSANTWLRRLVLSDQRYGNSSYLERSGHLENTLSQSGLVRLAGQLFPQPHSVTVIGLPRE